MPRGRLPRLPKEVFGPAGPILVKRKKNLTKDDESCDGVYNEHERTIYIASGLALRYAWPTLLHEQNHCWMNDMRYEFGKREEDLCNHLANCRMQLIWKSVEKGFPVII